MKISTKTQILQMLRTNLKLQSCY